MKITVEQILGKKPCAEWTGKRLRKHIGDGKELVDILELPDISADDKIWCVTKFLSDKVNRKFAIWCARQCETEVEEIADYIDVIERYYDNKATKKELDAANWAADMAADRTADRAADWAADSSADRTADMAADRTADRGADWAANWAANRAADMAADRAADWAAKMAADRTAQLKKLKELIKEGT